METGSTETQNIPGPVLERELGPRDETSRLALDTDSSTNHEDWYKLWQTHYDRFHRLGEPYDINEAIKYGIHALDATPKDHRVLSERHADLAVSYSERFWISDNLDDLQKSLEHDLLALATCPDGDSSLGLRHAQLGISFTDRFRRLGELQDLEKSIEHKTRALELTYDGHLALPDRCDSLGVAYSDRFGHLGDLGDLEKEIELFTRALALTPEDDPDLTRRHAQLGASYGDRFQRLGKLDDLEKSIEHGTRALTLTPDGDSKLSRRHAQLGVAYRDRFRRLGELKDLEKSIEHKTRALALTPKSNLSLPDQYATLGVAFIDRYQRLGDLADLDQAMEHKNRALNLTPAGHPDLADRHASLGSACTHRFHRLGEMVDLEKAIEHKTRALTLTPDRHVDLPRRHSDLAGAYTDRFSRLGEQADLEKAIEHNSHALALTPEDDPDLARQLANLGTSYGDRFQRLGELGDLEKSIEHNSRALALTPDGHPNLSRRHAKIGMSYRDKFHHLEDPKDLDKAIEHKTLALSLTPESHPDIPDRHTSLGVSFCDRFKLLGEPGDLDKSINYYDIAIASTPDGHPDLSERHFRCAEAFLLRHQHTDDSSHLQYSLDSFRKASQMSSGAPRDRFHYAIRWAEIAFKHSPITRIEAYQTAIDLLPQFIWLGATTSQRYLDLSTAENLAVNAAFIAILHSNHKLALEWLEHARCVVWNQSLMLRSPIDELRLSHPEIGTRLQIIAQQLHDITSAPPTSRAPASSVVNAEQAAQDRLRLAREYNETLTKARSLHGYGDFLRPAPLNRLAHTAQYGPIIVVNCHEDSCDALFILPKQDTVKHLSLPNFTAKKAQKARSELESCLRRKGLRERGVKARRLPGSKDTSIANVLLTLWQDIVQPVLEFLGYVNATPVGNLPHITWCPTGALSFLPLHAAGNYDEPQSKVFNYAISSYTPTLATLFSSTPTTLSRASRVLAIGQPHTPGHSPLPGTMKEIGFIKAHTESKVEFSELVDDEATAADVLDAMEQHDWVHLACHAHQNVTNPSKSGFFLHDGTLDLAAINRRSFKNKGLAFLSACQTATGDEKLPDEAIHLASGMLMAGYSSVIATMWSVSDSDAPLVADKVYGQLMKDGKVGSGEAGKALHAAIAELRAKIGEKEFARWVPYIHIGS